MAAWRKATTWLPHLPLSCFSRSAWNSRVRLATARIVQPGVRAARGHLPACQMASNSYLREVRGAARQIPEPRWGEHLTTGKAPEFWDSRWQKSYLERETGIEPATLCLESIGPHPDATPLGPPVAFSAPSSSQGLAHPSRCNASGRSQRCRESCSCTAS